MNRHLNDRRLLAYLESELSPRRRKTAASHIASCPSCQARLARLSRTSDYLTTTLTTVGDRVPLALERSWQVVSQHLDTHSPDPWVLRLRLPLHHLATLTVLAAFVVGLAGLIHTLATSDPYVLESTPTLEPTPTSLPIVIEPLPRPRPDHVAGPLSILLLGVDGEREASDVIDALVLLHVNPSSERVLLLSIPLDLYVETAGHGKASMDRVYQLGERDNVGGGLVLAQETVSATLGLPIQYAARVQLDGFIALIDTIGGVDVEVLHPVEDHAFPDDTGGYDPLVIPVGWQHFDGALALRYARTLVAPDPGFGRTFRQQQLILAAYDRVKRLHLLPEIIAHAPEVWATATESIETNLSLGIVVDLALLAASLVQDDFVTATLDDCCTTEHTVSGERVLLPLPEEIDILMNNLLEKS